MHVADHRLFTADGAPVRFAESPNQSGAITPRFLVVHYTAAAGLQSTVRWLQDPKARASAHLVIGRDGEIVQMVAFDRKAWHAGRSSWGEVTGLNAHSIGIELDNPGALTRIADGGWRTWFGQAVDARAVLAARHKADPPGAEPSGWPVYPAVQLEALMEAAAALHARYGFEAVLGHDDIAPGRKRDPGPAFPMEALRARLFGRDEDEGDAADTETCRSCGRLLTG